MLKTILTAADGSDHADRAIDWAAMLAATHGAKLVLVFVAPHRQAPAALRQMAAVEHVVEPRTAAPPVDPALADPVPADYEATLASSALIYRELGKRVLDAARRHAAASGVIEVETRIEDGDPAHEILKAAEDHGADLIVMGRRGLGDLGGLLLGSVTHKVSQLASCACLTVK